MSILRDTAVDQISSQILNGDLQSDSLLPSIRVMAKELRVSIIILLKVFDKFINIKSLMFFVIF